MTLTYSWPPIGTGGSLTQLAPRIEWKSGHTAVTGDPDTAHLDFVAEIKAVKDDDATMSFTGLASTFGNMDLQRDIVRPGAFEKSIKRRKASGIPLLWQHDVWAPIGVFDKIEETDKGLDVEGRLAEIQQGLEAHKLMEMGAIRAMSIGFRTVKDTFDSENNVRELLEVDLMEISLVTFPANPKAKIRSVKDMLADGETPSKRDVERALMRDAGFTRSHAQRLIAGGYDGLVKRDADEDGKEWADGLRERFAKLTGA